MSTERTWPFPASRTLATWWRQLARWQPRSLWVAHLLWHRLEAPVTIQQSCPLDPFDRVVLQAIALSPPATLAGLDAVLHLGRQVLYQVLRGLETAGLASAAEAAWSLTEQGRLALSAGAFPRPVHQRRSLTFLHREGEPRFLHLAAGVATPWKPEADWSFEVAALELCIAQPEDWKRRAGFPLEVAGLVRGPGLEALVIDRPEKLAAALVATESGRLLGFAVREDSWSVLAEAPVFDLTDWSELFPELAEPTAEQWQQAWQDWCQLRSLSLTAPVELQAAGHQLRASGAGLREQFGKRSDVLKGEAWLLVGGGPVRRAMQVEIG